jgi:hypothetical protein
MLRRLAMFGAIVAAATAPAGCQREADRPSAAVEVPTISEPIKLDGEWAEPDWSKRALRGQFRGDDGALARPSSEIRILRDTDTLYVGLYAADDNIQSSDAFDLTLWPLALTVTATGAVTPTIAGVRAAVDRDGTLDDATNFDEEWVVELAIPFAAIGGDPHTAIAVTAARCDVPKHGSKRCGRWSGSVAAH